jgi:hypothetical protein
MEHNRLEGATPDQLIALVKLYWRNADGAQTYNEFRNRAHSYHGGYIGLDWCGMFIGIEKDGYTHS